MAYSINPNIEKSRGKAVYDLLVNKVPLLIVARKWGVNRKTNFCPNYDRWLLKTESSAPKTHPQRITSYIT